ncbi:exported hypothetical protein [Xenorhabdus bovienii str. kraussei Quebec]|uniref:Uncharacterized protein n=1 Tax=Xenorhabdus bovienii str. kraussei Quebec TaxID=1398203 RepID=A0A077P260_XENBV|nr:exported hypothetical protein [Xenorhabdus bovienii str. kraussei Quebec]
MRIILKYSHTDLLFRTYPLGAIIAVSLNTAYAHPPKRTRRM